MSINNLNTYLNVRDAHLRVVSGNVYAQAMNIGGINIETAHGLQSVSDTGNVTSNTLQFSNATTGFVTTANAQIGRDLVVTGNATVSTDLTVSANATVTDTLTVSEHLLASKEATVTGNLHVTTIMSDSNVVAEYTGPHDRPLREYPEIAMTTASGTSSGYKGYKVSTSSQLSGYEGYKAFDKTGWETPAVENNNAWVSGGSKYVAGTGLPDTGAFTTSYVGGTATGEYIQLQLPRKIKISKYDYTPRTHTGNDEGKGAPKTVKLLGSNDDGSTWTLIKDITHMGKRPEEGVFYTAQVDATEYYDYIRFVATSTYSDGTSAMFTDVRLSQIRFYGYEEGSGSLDTTLKTVYNVPATTGTQLEVYYDGRETSSYSGSGTTVNDISPNTNNGTLGTGIGFDTEYKAFTFDGTANGKITGTHGLGTGTGIQYSMSLWFKADVLSGNHRLATFGTQGTQYQSSTLLIYQNDIHLDHWLSEIKTTSDILVPNVWYHLVAIHSGPGTEDVSQNALYLNGVKLEDVTTGGSAANGTFNLQGTGLTIGADSAGTNPFDGSIANFRLYSKALNADQVKELYDYQKDYFLGSKSQLTIYKGHLGVGVTEPSGQLELAGDERIQEYPPRALTGYSTHIEGHGVFMVEGDSFYTPTNPDLDPWRAFNDDNTLNFGRWRQANSQFTAGGGPIDNRRYAEGLPNASWLVLHLPYDVNLKGYSVCPQNGQSPENIQIWGSNDGGTTWTHLHSQTQTVGDNTTYQNYTISHEGHYSIIAYLILTLTPSTATEVSIRDMKYFGTPGPTTLDKGSLSLTRSLDVPRVSRYDVDTETPRPEKLVVDFDTTVNSSPTDISGRGNHGTFYGGASYSAAYKAFSFDGTDDYLLLDDLPQADGNFVHSVSYWLKDLRPSGAGAETFLYFGSAAVATQDMQIQYNYNGTGTIYFGTQGSWQTLSNFGDLGGTGKKLLRGEWNHYAYTYNGTNTSTSNMKFYINGEEMPMGGGGTAALSFSTGSTPFYIGRHASTSNPNYFEGEFSNFKMYNAKLEPSEVKKLYNLGRTGRSMVISDTAVGIGKAPEAQLDVRGIGKFETCHIRDSGISGTHGMLDINRGERTAGGQNPPSHTPPLYITGDINSNSNGIEFRHSNQSQGIGFGYNTIYATGYASGGGQDLSLKAFGTGTVRLNGGTAITSDDRLKTNEQYLTNATETLLKLKPQVYDKHQKINEICQNPVREAGLITQDVYYDAPELRFLVQARNEGLDSIIPVNIPEEKPFVDDDPTKDPDYSGWGTDAASLNYEGFIPYLIKSNQELHAEIQALEHKDYIQELRADNTRLKNKVAILENRQTHYNTLLVNLTGRIETLERGA